MNAQATADMPTARLAAWRAEGAWRLDPVRFRVLEALADRAAQQQEPVRSIARRKLEEGVAAFATRLDGATPRDVVRARASAHAPKPHCEPLAGLNAHLREASASRTQAEAPGQPVRHDELASVRAFRQAWTRGRAQEQVAQALARKPANAGPLNSHALVLQSIELMREISPAYLRRFLAQVETLQWLEQAGAALPAGGGKAKDAKAVARKGRGKSAK